MSFYKKYGIIFLNLELIMLIFKTFVKWITKLTGTVFLGFFL